MFFNKYNCFLVIYQWKNIIMVGWVGLFLDWVEKLCIIIDR